MVSGSCAAAARAPLLLLPVILAASSFASVAAGTVDPLRLSAAPRENFDPSFIIPRRRALLDDAAAVDGRRRTGGFGFRQCAGVKAQDALPHTLRRLREATVSYDPYAHVFIREVFPPGYYACMLLALPRDDERGVFDRTNKDKRAYRRISGDGAGVEAGTGPRTRWRNRFWRDFSRTFGGEEVRDAYLWLFRTSVRARFRHLDLRPPAGRTGGGVDAARRRGSSADDLSQFQIRLDLSRDGDGYSITPHTDSVAKAVTMLYYLPEDDTRMDLGTRVYRSEVDDGGYGMTWKNWSRTGPPARAPGAVRDTSGGGEEGVSAEGGDGGSPDERDRGGRMLFEEIEAAPFVPNAVFAFAPCRSSWHAVRPVVGVGTRRDTVQGFVRIASIEKKSVKKYFAERAKATGNVVVDTALEKYGRKAACVSKPSSS